MASRCWLVLVVACASPTAPKKPRELTEAERTENGRHQSRVCMLYSARRDADLESWGRSNERIDAACSRAQGDISQNLHANAKLRTTDDAGLPAFLEWLETSSDGLACEIINRCSGSLSTSRLSTSRDGTLLLTVESEESRLWELRGRSWVRKPVHDAADVLSPDGSISARLDNGALVIVDEKGRTAFPTGLESHHSAIAISSDNKWIVVGGMSVAATVLPVAGGDAAPLPQPRESEVFALSPVAPIAYYNGQIIDLATRKPLARITLAPPIDGVAERPCAMFSPRGDRVAICGQVSGPESVQLFDTTTGKLAKTLAHAPDVSSIAFSRDGNFVVGGGGGFFVWRVADGALVVDDRTPLLRDLAVTANGVTVVNASGAVRVRPLP